MSIIKCCLCLRFMQAPIWVYKKISRFCARLQGYERKNALRFHTRTDLNGLRELYGKKWIRCSTDFLFPNTKTHFPVWQSKIAFGSIPPSSTYNHLNTHFFEEICLAIKPPSRQSIIFAFQCRFKLFFCRCCWSVMISNLHSPPITLQVQSKKSSKWYKLVCLGQTRHKSIFIIYLHFLVSHIFEQCSCSPDCVHKLLIAHSRRTRSIVCYV